MTAKSALSQDTTAKLVELWQQNGQKLMTLAEEFPEARYDWKPAEGVRTVGEVLRHAAFWNRYVTAAASGQPYDVQANELPPQEFATKKKIVEALRGSFADAAKALAGTQAGTDPKLTELIVSFIAHNSEHYGQLAVYARLSAIVPPASRG